MPNKLSHESCVKALCLLCLNKRALRPLTENQKILVKQYVFHKFEEYEQFLPNGLCNHCRCQLSSLPGQSPEHFTLLPDFEQIVQDFCAGRVGGHDCSCELCVVATWSKKKGGSKPPSSQYLRSQLQQGAAKQSTGLESKPSMSPAVLSHPCSPNTPTSSLSPSVRCSFCHSVISSPSASHDCNPSVRRKNLLGELTPKGKANAAACYVREQVEATESPVVALANPRGRPTEVTVASSKAKRCLIKPPPLSHETLFHMQDVAGLSNNALLKQGQVIRQQTQNRQAIAGNLKAALVARGHRLSPFFGFKNLSYLVKGDKVSDSRQTVSKPTILVKDLNGLINFVGAEREVTKYRLKLGLDGGGGFLKATLNVIEDTPPLSPTSPLAKKPALDSFKFLDTGVKKLFIIGLAQNVPECYENVKTLVRELPLDVTFCTSADLKMLNILVGIGPHSSSCPCTWCEAHSKDFRSDFVAPLRTFARIRHQARLYKEAVRQKKKFTPQTYFSCVEEPILRVRGDVVVLDAIAPPQLHLMMGVTSKIWDELLVRLEKDALADKKVVEEWARLQNIAKKDYRGGVMEGNQCRKLLKKSLDLIPHLPQKYKLFGLALHRFDDVVSSCFGMHVVGDFEKSISDFKAAYGALGLSVTPKIHATVVHVPEWIKRHEARTGQRVGLGYASEQASESVHRDFLNRWEQGYKVSESNDKYADQLLRCVVRYNSSHI